MSKSKKFWRIENSVERDNSTLYLDGPIASESWWGDEVTPQEFRSELKALNTNKLTVVINSGGGDVWAGVAIYDALKELDAEVTVKVSGLAASIASVIAMAGDRIVMTPGSTMMIHRASTIVWGDANDLQKCIDMLETVEDGIVDIYADRTGQDKDTVKQMMDDETWMSAEKAVELGFADEVVKPAKNDETEESPENVFSGNFAFSMSATKQALNSFSSKVAKSEAESEEEESEEQSEEVETDEKPEVDTEQVEESIQEPGDDEVVDPSEPVEPTKPTEEEKEIDMKSKQEEIAQEQVIAPSNQAPVVDEAKAVKDYLKSKESVEAFARILEKEAGNTSEDVRNAWKQHLEVEMGVTNPEVLLPDALITEIEDAFKRGGEIWNRVTKTGLEVFRAAWDTATGEDSRAKGYNREDEENKAEESITIADRVLRPQFIYKYITLNKEDVKAQRSTGALVRYVLSELPRRIVREVERAIVIGDGRANDSDYKITSFTSVKADTTAENVFGETYTPVEGESMYAVLLHAKDLLDTEGTPTLIAKKGFLTDVMLEENANGGFLFAPGSNVAGLLGFDAVVEPDWMTEDEDNDAYLVVLPNYKTVGDNTIEAFTNFVLRTNKQEYLQELWAGGGLTVRKSAVAIAASSES